MHATHSENRNRPPDVVRGHLRLVGEPAPETVRTSPQADTGVLDTVVRCAGVAARVPFGIAGLIHRSLRPADDSEVELLSRRQRHTEDEIEAILWELEALRAQLRDVRTER